MKLRLVKIHRKKLIDKGGSFLIYIVAHDGMTGMFTVISRVNCCRVNSELQGDSERMKICSPPSAWKMVNQCAVCLKVLAVNF